MSEEKAPTEAEPEESTPEPNEAKAKPTPEDAKVVEKVMAERKEKKKPKRKVVKNDEGLKKFIKAKKIKTNKAKNANKDPEEEEGGIGLSRNATLGAIAIGTLIGGGLYLAQTQTMPNFLAQNQPVVAPPSGPQGPGRPAPPPPAQRPGDLEGMDVPSWLARP